MTIDDLLKQGIAALNAGRKEEARNLLTHVVEQDERNEMGWLWLSGAVDTDQERRICLENVLAINPSNRAAKRGLESLTVNGAGQPLSAVSLAKSSAESAAIFREQSTQSPAEASTLDVPQRKKPEENPKCGIVKRGSKYAVEGDGDGWLFNRTFPTKWKAKLAMEVFSNGGRVSDYWKEARREKEIRAVRGEAKRKARREKDLGREEAKRKLIGLIDSEPDNADLRFKLALMLMRASSSNHWKDWHVVLTPGIDLIADQKMAKEQLNTALGIGLDNPLDAAKARFLLIECILSEARASPGKRALEEYPELGILARDIVSDAKKHLRRYPHDIGALNLQRAAYSLMENQSGVGRTELALAQARSLRKAGLVANKKSSVQAKRGKKRRTDGIDLEKMAEKLLRAMGLKATTTKVSGDGGIDIVAYSDSPIFAGKYIAQCKDWTNPVGEPVVRDLFGAVMSEGANKGILITTGRFTASAERFAEGKPLELIDGDSLRRLLKQYKV